MTNRSLDQNIRAKPKRRRKQQAAKVELVLILARMGTVPGCHIIEVDIDRLPWDHELLTHVPQIEIGGQVVLDGPSWGAEPNEAALRARPPRTRAGLMHYKDE